MLSLRERWRRRRSQATLTTANTLTSDATLAAHDWDEERLAARNYTEKGGAAFTDPPISRLAPAQRLRDDDDDSTTTTTRRPTWRMEPWLGLRPRLFLCLVSPSFLALLLVALRLLSAADDVDDRVALAKERLVAACREAEGAAARALSVPHYMALGVNARTAQGVEESVRAVAHVLMLGVEAIEETLVFLVNSYRSLFLCFIELLVRASLSILSAALDALNAALQDVARGLKGSIQASVDGANAFLRGALAGVNDVIGVFGKHVDPPTIASPNLSGLDKLSLPDSLTSGLRSLNASLPTLMDLKTRMDGVIRTPFENLKTEINSTMTNFSFDRSLLPVPATRTMRFCDSRLDPSLLDSMGRDVRRLVYWGLALLVALLLAFAALNLVLEWYAWRCMHRHVERTREAFLMADGAPLLATTREAVCPKAVDDEDIHASRPREGAAAARPPGPGGQWAEAGTEKLGATLPASVLSNRSLFSLTQLATHPLLASLALRLGRRVGVRREASQARLRWWLAWCCHPMAVAVLCTGLVGLLSVQIQILAVRRVEDHYQKRIGGQFDSWGDELMGELNRGLLDASADFANRSNVLILDAQDRLNHGMFSWVNTTTSTINNTLNEFSDGIYQALNDAFSNTPLLQPLQGFVACILGQKVAGVEKALTWIQSNARANFSTLPADALLLGPDEMEALVAPARNAALGGGGGGEAGVPAANGTKSDQGVVPSIIGAYVRGLENERFTFGILVLIYAGLLLIGTALVLLNALFVRTRARAESEESSNGDGDGRAMDAGRDWSAWAKVTPFVLRSTSPSPSSMPRLGRSNVRTPSPLLHRTPSPRPTPAAAATRDDSARPPLWRADSSASRSMYSRASYCTSASNGDATISRPLHEDVARVFADTSQPHEGRASPAALSSTRSAYPPRAGSKRGGLGLGRHRGANSLGGNGMGEGQDKGATTGSNDRRPNSRGKRSAPGPVRIDQRQISRPILSPSHIIAPSLFVPTLSKSSACTTGPGEAVTTTPNGAGQGGGTCALLLPPSPTPLDPPPSSPLGSVVPMLRSPFLERVPSPPQPAPKPSQAHEHPSTGVWQSSKPSSSAAAPGAIVTKASEMLRSAAGWWYGWPRSEEPRATKSSQASHNRSRGDHGQAGGQEGFEEKPPGVDDSQAGGGGAILATVASNQTLGQIMEDHALQQYSSGLTMTCPSAQPCDDGLDRFPDDGPADMAALHAQGHVGTLQGADSPGSLRQSMHDTSHGEEQETIPKAEASGQRGTPPSQISTSTTLECTGEDEAAMYQPSPMLGPTPPPPPPPPPPLPPSRLLLAPARLSSIREVPTPTTTPASTIHPHHLSSRPWDAEGAVTAAAAFAPSPRAGGPPSSAATLTPRASSTHSRSTPSLPPLVRLGSPCRSSLPPAPHASPVAARLVGGDERAGDAPPASASALNVARRSAPLPAPTTTTTTTAVPPAHASRSSAQPQPPMPPSSWVPAGSDSATSSSPPPGRGAEEGGLSPRSPRSRPTGPRARPT